MPWAQERPRRERPCRSEGRSSFCCLRRGRACGPRRGSGHFGRACPQSGGRVPSDCRLGRFTSSGAATRPRWACGPICPSPFGRPGWSASRSPMLCSIRSTWCSLHSARGSGGKPWCRLTPGGRAWRTEGGWCLGSGVPRTSPVCSRRPWRGARSGSRCSWRAEGWSGGRAWPRERCLCLPTPSVCLSGGWRFGRGRWPCSPGRTQVL
ncbi:hypothetical protein GGP85_001375 [Salinibacter ruber]|nr:hypothetical protein [Salinibacter ruber]MCS3825928.1 hypothetical protein [Salinibacter ruber]MCS4145058.1 hypothetical protein [Salinibacter ruber]